MTTPTWHTDTPTRSGWFTTDHDSALRRYFNGAGWSAPVHVDDLDRLGERVRLVPAEPRDDAIVWHD